MIKLELRNTKTQKSVFVDTRGAVFGREGGDADVKLADQGVSKKHARIYARKGEWFLEDLNSANGTYLDSQRINQAVLLEPGALFTLSRQQFEVVQIVEEEAEATQLPRQDLLASSDEGDEQQSDDTEDRGDEDEAQDDRGDEPAGDEEEHQETVPPNPPPSRRPEARGAPAPQASARSAARPAPGPAKSAARPQQQAIEADDAPEGFDIKYFMKAVPKALGYYLVSIPVMLVNPIGFVNKSIDQQKVPAMGKMQLIAYAFPPYAAMAAMGFLGALLASLAAGALSIGAILPIGPIITAVVGSVVAGFIWHPVTEWIINKLGGDSDAKSRTNMFVAVMTATALMGVPAVVGGILAFIPLIVLKLIPVLLTAVVTLVMMYSYYAWMKHFGVVKWFQYGILALAGLSALGVVGQSIDVIKASISGIGSSSGVEMAAGSSDDDEVPEEWKQQMEAAKASGSEEMVAAVRTAMKQSIEGKKAMEQAQAAGQQGSDKAENAQKDAAAMATASAFAKPEDVAAAKVQPAATNDTAQVETASVKKDVVKLDMPPAPTAPAKVRGMAYPEYKKKLTAIENAISDDPTLLRRVDGLLPIYEDLHRARFQAEERVKASQKKSEKWQSGVNSHLRDAEVYKETQELVTRVHAKMFP